MPFILDLKSTLTDTINEMAISFYSATNKGDTYDEIFFLSPHFPERNGQP